MENIFKQKCFNLIFNVRKLKLSCYLQIKLHNTIKGETMLFKDYWSTKSIIIGVQNQLPSFLNVFLQITHSYGLSCV